MQRFTSTLRLRALRTPLPRATPVLSIRHASTSSPKSAEGASAESGGSRSKSAAESSSQSSSSDKTNSVDPSGIPDSLSDGDMRGRTGGGEPLESSDHAPRRPKVWNHAVKGTAAGKGLTEEQQAEVDEHNRDFEKKHDRANAAEDDRVDKSFWDRDGGSKE